MLSSIFLLGVNACAPAMPQQGTESPAVIGDVNGSKALANVFAHQHECYNAWSNLLQEWHSNGGGIKDSVLATRVQIAADKKSAFARIVRQIWASQKASEAPLSFGSWPIDDAEFRRAVETPNTAVEKMLPKGCEPFVWLNPLLWDEVVDRKNGTVTERKLLETPANMEWDSYSAPLWLSYWIFVRLE